MASVNAEVMLYFGISLDDEGGKDFSDAVSVLRFDLGMETRAIIDLINKLQVED
jgi:hypothetical protein